MLPRAMLLETALFFKRFPSLLALLIQLAAFFMTMVAASGWPVLSTVLPWPVAAAAFQGALAGLFARLSGQDTWWLPMHFLFPVTVALTAYAELPSGLFLIGFLLFAALYWNAFRTRVPFYPSGKNVWRVLLKHLPEKKLALADVGSGMGGLLLHVAQERKDVRCVGIETAPLPWFVSRMRAAVGGSACRFYWGRYESFSFTDLDVVFAYLSPAAMPDLWEKARADMRPGSLLFSLEFSIPGVPPSWVIDVPEQSARLYCWRM